MDQDATKTPPLSHLSTLPAIYMAAEYKWEFDGHWWPIHIGEHAPELDAAFPGSTRFGMLTASNPGNLPRSDAENRAADLALQLQLERLRLRHRPGFAIAQNRAWKAYNWLVIDAEEDVFDSLGRQFGQIGTLLWRRGAAVRLRMRATRPAMLAEHPHIDWIGEELGARPTPSEAIPAVNT